jgi:hypothetical protein
MEKVLENTGLIKRFDVFRAVTIKNAIFRDIRAQFIPHRRHTVSLLQNPAS